MGFVRNVSGTIGAKIVIIGIGFFSGMITARWLGPHDRGILSLVSSIPPTIWMLSSLGINQASVYFINKEKYPLKNVIGLCFLAPLTMGLGFSLVFWFSRNSLIFKAFPYLNNYFLLLALLPLPFILVQNSFVGVLRAVDRFFIINIRQIARSAFGLLIGMVVLIYMGKGVSSLLLCFVVLDIVVALWMVLEVHRICKIRPFFEKKMAIDFLQFGVKSYLQNMIGFLHNRIDLYMIAYFLVPAQIAFYDIAVVLGELLLFIPQSITFVILPDLVRGKGSKKIKSIARIARISLFISFIMGTGLFYFGRYFIELVYGAEFIESYKVLTLLLPGLVLSALNGVTIPHYTSIARQRVTMICSGISLILNMLLNYFFIPLYGVYGAAVTTTLTYSAFSLMLLWVFIKEEDCRFSDMLIIRREDFKMIFEHVRSINLRR